MAATVLSLGIENGIHNVQSQHIGECAYDSIQMTLLFADGFRPIFANAAESMLNFAFNQKDPEKLTINKLFNLDPLFEYTVAEYFGLPSETTYLKSFLTRAIRRYILIRLQDGGWTLPHIYQHFQITSIETSCVLPFKQARPKGVLGRRTSLNTQAGLTAAESAMKMIGAEISIDDWELKTRGISKQETSQLWDAILPNVQKPVVLSGKFRKSTVFEAENFGNLVCVYILSMSTSGGGHANTILRYRDKFYYCDNEIGVALELSKPLTPDLAMKPDSVVFDFTETTSQVLINNEEYVRSSLTFESSSKFVSFEIIYIYSMEPTALPLISSPITIPPSITSSVISEPISIHFSKTMSRSGNYWGSSITSLDAKNAALAARFSKTARAARSYWANEQANGRSVGTRKFTRTLRADRWKN